MLNANARYVALDVETTGLSPQKGHRIIGIGAVAIEDSRITEEFDSLVSIDRKIPQKAQLIHGITDEMIEGQPKAEDVLPRLYDFLGDSIIIAHNARFDMEFLRHETGRLSLTLRNRYVCTLKLSRRCYPGLPDYRLDTVYRHVFGEIPEDIQRHRALDDARIAARIWMEMVKR